MILWRIIRFTYKAAGFLVGVVVWGVLLLFVCVALMLWVLSHYSCESC